MVLPIILKLGVPGLCIGIFGNLFFAFEVAFLSRFSTETLAAAAIVFPFIFLAPNLSAGSFGGAVLRLLIVASGLLWITTNTGANSLLWLLVSGLAAYGIVIPVVLYFGAWNLKKNSTQTPKPIGP